MISSTIIYLELFIALFFLPGFFITIILGIKKFRFVLSFALSYSLLVLTLLPFEYYAQPIARWQWCILLEWVILAILAVAKTFIDGNFKTSNVQRSTSNAQPQMNGFGFNVESWMLSVQSFSRGRSALIRRLSIRRLIVPLVLAGVICGYLAYAGVYLEIPSDAWNHVVRFQWQKLDVIERGFFTSGSLFNTIFLTQVPRHFIHAWLCHVSGLPIMDSLHVLTFVNVLTFLLAIYYFGLFLFAGLRISTFRKMMMAAFASLFAAATLGNMVFAYIRYYAFAPAILNYVLFLAAMAVIIDWLRSDRWLGHALWIAPVLLIVTNMIHTQETLFIFFMTLALGIMETVRILWRKLSSLARHSRNQCVSRVCHSQFNRESRIRINSDTLDSRFRGNDIAEEIYGNRWMAREWKIVILTAVLLIMFFAGFAAVRHFKPGVWISSNMIMPHVAIPSEPVNFIFNKLLISPPHNFYLRLAVYQLFIFYQVVGCWGLFVYPLFLLMIRHFVKIPYLTSGMVIVPLLTAFNPLTVDMMVRFGQDPTIYRFHYLIPLPFVGGYLFVHFLGKAREWFQRMRSAPAESVSPIWPRLSWINFIGCLLILAGLIGLVFPINAAGIYAPYSKIYTLRKIPAGNDYHLCDDLGKIMAKYENKVILTDGWTAEILRHYSPKNTYSHVKWLNSLNPENEPPDPYTWEKLRNRGLIIINRRNGGLSITGRIAKHWPEDVLPKVNRFYSLETQHYLESHPEKFQKIWSRNQIAVYSVY